VVETIFSPGKNYFCWRQPSFSMEKNVFFLPTGTKPANPAPNLTNKLQNQFLHHPWARLHKKAFSYWGGGQYAVGPLAN